MRYSTVLIHDENLAVWLYRGRRDPPPNPWDDSYYQDDPGPYFGEAPPIISDLAWDIYMWLTHGGAPAMLFEGPRELDVNWSASCWPMHPLEWADDTPATPATRAAYAAYLGPTHFNMTADIQTETPGLHST